MRKGYWASLAVGALVASPSASIGAVNQPESLPRTGQWQVNYDEDACHLIGSFGSGSDAVVARFTRYQPGSAFDFTLVGKRFKAPGNRPDIAIDFGNGTILRLQPAWATVDSTPMVIFNSVRLDGAKLGRAAAATVTPAQENAVAAATIGLEGKRRFRLEFGSLGKPFEALRACQSDLVKHWGYDPDIQSKLSRAATPNGSPTSWLVPDDYPDNAVNSVTGYVQYRLDVDEAGTVAGCHILNHTDSDMFGTATCRALNTRAKFTPALNASGAPVRSFYVGRVYWEV